jgi:hypothetical protein
MLSKLLSTALVTGLLGLAAPPALADSAGQACFYPNQWQNWTSPSPEVIYLRVNVNDVYRLDVVGGGTSQLQYPGAHLISDYHGTAIVCSPVDLDLYVAASHGTRVPVIVKSMTKLTPEEVAALPPKAKP